MRTGKRGDTIGPVIQRHLLRRVDLLVADQPIRNLHLGAPKRFAAQLLEGVQHVRGHNDLADDDVVREDEIAPDGLDDWPRIGEPAGLERCAGVARRSSRTRYAHGGPRRTG